ncbi:MAG TPA: hypothetical protein VIP98_09165 [Microlunatus sp.]
MLKENSHRRWWSSRPPKPNRGRFIRPRGKRGLPPDVTVGFSVQAYPTIVFVRRELIFPDPRPTVVSSQREENKITKNLIFSHDEEIKRLRRPLSAE